MAYTHDGYVLYTKEISWGPHGNKRRIYFFSKKTPKSGEPVDELPEGMKVIVNQKTGLPVLGRINPIERKRRKKKRGRKKRKKSKKE